MVPSISPSVALYLPSGSGPPDGEVAANKPNEQLWGRASVTSTIVVQLSWSYGNRIGRARFPSAEL